MTRNAFCSVDRLLTFCTHALAIVMMILNLEFILQASPIDQASIGEDATKTFQARLRTAPWTSSATLPQKLINTVSHQSLPTLGSDLWLKTLACTGQVNPTAFNEARKILNTFLLDLSPDDRQHLAAKTAEHPDLQQFLGLAECSPENRVRAFFGHTFNAKEIEATIQTAERAIANASADDDVNGHLERLSRANQTLYAARNAIASDLPVTLALAYFFHTPAFEPNDPAFYDWLKEMLLQQSFLELAKEKTAAALAHLKENAAHLSETEFYPVYNALTLMHGVQNAAYIAISKLITQEGDGQILLNILGRLYSIYPSVASLYEYSSRHATGVILYPPGQMATLQTRFEMYTWAVSGLTYETPTGPQPFIPADFTPIPDIMAAAENTLPAVAEAAAQDDPIAPAIPAPLRSVYRAFDTENLSMNVLDIQTRYAEVNKVLDATRQEYMTFAQSLQNKISGPDRTDILRSNAYTLLIKVLRAGSAALKILQEGQETNPEFYNFLSAFYHKALELLLDNPDAINDDVLQGAKASFMELVGDFTAEDGQSLEPIFQPMPMTKAAAEASMIDAQDTLADAHQRLARMALAAQAFAASDPQFFQDSVDLAGLTSTAQLLGAQAEKAIQDGNQEEAAQLLLALQAIKTQMKSLNPQPTS